MDFTGTSRVLGVSLLGTELPVDELVKQTVSIVGGGSVTLADLDITKLVPQGIAPELFLALQAQLKPLLAQVKIDIPKLLADVRITPGKQVRTATGLTQTALDVHIAIAGQPILDAQIGEAKVGAEGLRDGTDDDPARPRPLAEAERERAGDRPGVVVLDHQHVGVALEHPPELGGPRGVERGAARVLRAGRQDAGGGAAAEGMAERVGQDAGVVERHRLGDEAEGRDEIDHARITGILDPDAIAGPVRRLQGALVAVERAARHRERVGG
jgi:hypothetical protein